MIESRFTVNLLAGRSILGKWCSHILTNELPGIINKSLFFTSLDRASLFRHVEVFEDAEWLRNHLDEANRTAFIANGSILPRKSGVSDLPMDSPDVIRFASPPSLFVEFTLPNHGKIGGMGIPKGITLIVGGGFHGKSTLLHAIENGVYNHIPGDGREFVVSDFHSVKLRAEDGRSVEGVNISPFITNLPQRKDTSSFSTACASGSTSQATNIMEMMEMGCKTLLLDEDTCALNFMIRDARMKALVSAEKEPITPFLSRIRDLISSFSASVILVIGGAGDFFSVANTVIMMDAYKAKDVTNRAKEIHHKFQSLEKSMMQNRDELTDDTDGVCMKDRVPFDENLFRRVILDVYSSDAGSQSKFHDPKVSVRSKSIISYGDEEIDLTCAEQINERSQARSIASAISLIRKKLTHGTSTVSEIVDQVDHVIEFQGLDVLSPGIKFGDLSRPRKYEIAAALNRLRTLKIKTNVSLQQNRK